MASKKQLLLEYNKRIEAYEKNHQSVQNRLEQRREFSMNIKTIYQGKVDSLNRLRNK